MLIRSAAIVAACLAVAPLAMAQAQPAPLPAVITPSPVQPTLTQPQLRQLLAPIALYPDPLLANILAAATYPAQIVEAQRFVSDPAQAGLPVVQLTDDAATHDWNPSVIALLAFPQVLQMMDANLEWTEHLGRVFIAQQADVLNAVQALRQLAQQAGTLTTGPNDSVTNEGDDIQILPPSPQDVFVPNYNPACVYGGDPNCAPDQGQVGWLTEALLPYGVLQWGALDWRHRNIRRGDGDRSDRPAWHHDGGGRHDHDFSHDRDHGFAHDHGFIGDRSLGHGSAFNYAPPANRLYASRPSFHPANPVAGPVLRPPVQRSAAPFVGHTPAAAANGPAGHR